MRTAQHGTSRLAHVRQVMSHLSDNGEFPDVFIRRCWAYQPGMELAGIFCPKRSQEAKPLTRAQSGNPGRLLDACCEASRKK